LTDPEDRKKFIGKSQVVHH